MIDSSKENSRQEEDVAQSQLPYFNLDNALAEAKREFVDGQLSDKAKSGALLIGKTLFNVGLFTGKLGLEAVKAAPAMLENISNEMKLIQAKYDEMSDDELLRIIHTNGFFSKNEKEKGVALSILKTRGLSANEIGSRKP